MKTDFNINEKPFLQYIQILKEFALKKLGIEFSITEQDIEPIKSLLAYFCQDQSLTQEMGLNLKKGIALMGPVGCGKTTIMKLFSLLITSDEKFTLKPTHEIINEFHEAGRVIIQKYSKDLRVNGQRAYFPSKNYCFDDVGIEGKLVYYGEKIDVIGEILTARYDIKFIKTHITTNLNTEDLKELYGSRLASRMREMFNVINFQENIKDKRK